MPAKIVVCGMYNKVPADAIGISTVSKVGRWAGLSPFNLGPCELYGGVSAVNMENAWQFAKVYECHVDRVSLNPTSEYWAWAHAGWSDPKPHRYPMGKGMKPLYSYWDGKRLDYIAARKAIYAPLYALAVQRTDSYRELAELYQKSDNTIVLRDYDGYDHDALGMTLTDVINNQRRKMGHAFVLKALLTNDLMFNR